MDKVGFELPSSVLGASSIRLNERNLLLSGFLIERFIVSGDDLAALVIEKSIFKRKKLLQMDRTTSLNKRQPKL